MKLNFYNIILVKILTIFLLSSSSTNAAIYKLNCKNYNSPLGGNKNVKTSIWYINDTKKKVALAKINKKKVKIKSLSKKWSSNKGYGISKDNRVFIDEMQININGYEYGLAITSGKKNTEFKGSILLFAFSESGLKKDQNYIKTQKELDKKLAIIKQKKKKKQNYKKDYSVLLKLNEKNKKIIDSYSIAQECSAPIKVK